jgi:hypothetical protein
VFVITADPDAGNDLRPLPSIAAMGLGG